MLRVIAGGKLTQAQVDDLNKVVEKLAPGGKTTSDVGVDLISGFEGTRFTAYDDGVGVWTIGTGTTVYPNGVKVKKGMLVHLSKLKPTSNTTWLNLKRLYK